MAGEVAGSSKFITEKGLKTYHELVKAKLKSLKKDIGDITIGDATITVKVGDEDLTTFSTNQQADSSISIPAASTEKFGVLKIGDDLTATNGVVKVNKTTQVTKNSTQPVTSGAVYSAIQDAVTSVIDYKGTIGTGGTVTSLPTTNIKKGMAYRVITAGTYAGQTCEVGDIIIAVGTTNANSSWTVIQNNIDLSGVASSIKIGNNGVAIAPSNGVITLPAYPVVNNAKLSLKIAGSEATSFTANQAEGTDFNIPAATEDNYGVVKVAGTNTGSVAGTPGITANRYYGVGKDKDNRLYVNIPWTDRYHTAASFTGTTTNVGMSITGVNGHDISANIPAATTTLYGVAMEYDAAQINEETFSFEETE